jgi:hypothetical protein
MKNRAGDCLPLAAVRRLDRIYLLPMKSLPSCQILRPKDPLRVSRSPLIQEWRESGGIPGGRLNDENFLL